MRKLSWFAGVIAIAGAALAQPPIRLKGWTRGAARTVRGALPRRTRTPGRTHLVVQFAKNPGVEQVAALTKRGVTTLSYVPDDALSVSASDRADFAGLGIQWIGRLQPSEKISPELRSELSSATKVPVVVEFYRDVASGEGRTIANESGLVILDNPDLLSNDLLLSGTGKQLLQLAQWDEVSYIFPASQDLVQGNPVHACAGALTSAGPVGQAVPLVGDGWDGPGLGSASLNYAFVNITQQVPPDSAESEIERAYAEWAKAVQVTFTQSADATAPQTLSVLFASGAHGDGYPFTPGVLAHTFYPVPVNAEPIAGDQHFNADESWKIGADVDVFSVALHETGHALGLGHSDNPADVMYPYYHIVTGLSPGDIAAVQQLYAANNSSDPAITQPPALPAPLALTIQPTVSTTSSSSLAMSGTASGGSGTIQVSWSTSQGASGMAQGSSNWTIVSLPLSVGANIIVVTATDSTGDHATQSVTVTEQAPSPPADNPPSSPSSPPSNPGSGTGAPPSITILSPAVTTYSTSASSIVVSGTASDGAGVALVTWSSSTGGSGTASGTNSWSTGPIPLYIGITTITVCASDAAGNQAWRSLTVTRD
jgi:Matrixin